MPYTMDPYTLLFVIPISVLFTLTLITYLVFQGSKCDNEQRMSEKRGARWQTPRVVRVKQSNAQHVQNAEWILLIIRNTGDSSATGVRVWATAEERELKVRKTKKLSFPPVSSQGSGISINPNRSAEFLISNIDPNQDFWIQWKEDGILKSRLLSKAHQTTLGIWTGDSADTNN
jgi:hypothetical protein